MKVILAVLFLAAAASAELQCPSKQATDWSIELLLRHEDCNKFWKCTYGVPIEKDCVSGLHFNLDTWQCDWPENVDCQDRNIPGQEKPNPEVQPEPEPEVEAQPEPEPEVEAQPEPEPEVEAQPEPEPEVEAQPEPEPEVGAQPEPEPEVEALPEPEPEVEAQPEPEPEEEAQPEQEPDVEAQPEPEPDAEDDNEENEKEQQELEFLENGCPVDPHVHWLLPHEEDCNLFYYCVWGRKQLRQCSASLHFNRVLQVCDWSSEAECAVSANKHYEARVAYRNWA